MKLKLILHFLSLSLFTNSLEVKSVSSAADTRGDNYYTLILTFGIQVIFI
jgi:hypothetical protein